MLLIFLLPCKFGTLDKLPVISLKLVALGEFNQIILYIVADS